MFGAAALGQNDTKGLLSSKCCSGDWNIINSCLLLPYSRMPSSMPAARRGFCKISLPALRFSSRAKGMGILVLVFIFISLTQHGKTRKAWGGEQDFWELG